MPTPQPLKPSQQHVIIYTSLLLLVDINQHHTGTAPHPLLLLLKQELLLHSRQALPAINTGPCHHCCCCCCCCCLLATGLQQPQATVKAPGPLLLLLLLLCPLQCLLLLLLLLQQLLLPELQDALLQV
jgi:hypothetical protein